MGMAKIHEKIKKRKRRKKEKKEKEKTKRKIWKKKIKKFVLYRGMWVAKKPRCRVKIVLMWVIVTVY